jgi:cyanophycin synthetase
LKSFTSSFEQNPGRLNIIDTHSGRVILDYAHNPVSLEALGSALMTLRSKYARIVGSMSVPGDRRDEDILAMGERAASNFDQMVFWEDEDLRGREKGTVRSLLAQGTQAADGCVVDKVEDQCAAARACFNLGRRGDLILITAADVEAVWQLIRQWSDKPVRARRKRQAVEGVAA